MVEDRLCVSVLQIKGYRMRDDQIRAAADVDHLPGEILAPEGLAAEIVSLCRFVHRSMDPPEPTERGHGRQFAVLAKAGTRHHENSDSQPRGWAGQIASTAAAVIVN